MTRMHRCLSCSTGPAHHACDCTGGQGKAPATAATGQHSTSASAPASALCAAQARDGGMARPIVHVEPIADICRPEVMHLVFCTSGMFRSTIAAINSILATSQSPQHLFFHIVTDDSFQQVGPGHVPTYGGLHAH